MTTIRGLMFGIVGALLLIGGGFTFIAALGKENPAVMDNQDFAGINASFYWIGGMKEQVDSIQTATEVTPEWGIFGALNALIKSAWESLKGFFTSLSFLTDSFGKLNIYFQVPNFIVALMGMAITILIAFIIYSAIFQKDV